MEGIGRLWKLSRTTRYLKNLQFSSKTTTLASLERSENSTRSKTNYNIREGKVRSARDAHGEGDVGATSYPSSRILRCACWLPCRSTNTCKVTFCETYFTFVFFPQRRLATVSASGHGKHHLTRPIPQASLGWTC